MMSTFYYLESRSTDPFYNLALEQYVFDFLPQGTRCFMLWQNDNAVIIGKFQNAIREINAEYVRENNIKVARRLSGGGAVYHDMGNLNFTFIDDAENAQLDFSPYCKPVISMLERMGVPAKMTGRNDMTVDGKKFSGNAQYIERGRIMHHGTILFDSDLTVLSKALNVKPDKFTGKGIRSVESRVTNLKPYLPDCRDIRDFMAALRKEIHTVYDVTPLVLSGEDNAKIISLRDRVYSQWDWNYGFSPEYGITKERYIEGCGTIRVSMDVAGGGAIRDLCFCGDYFAVRNPEILAEMLKGCLLENSALRARLAETGTDPGLYFRNLSLDRFVQLLTE